MAILRACLALVLGLYIEFVALTVISPLWTADRSAWEFAGSVVIATLLSFGCGCVIALIAGGSAIPVFAVLALFTGLTALVTGDDLLIGLLMMVVLPASAGVGVLVIRKRSGGGGTEKTVEERKSDPARPVRHSITFVHITGAATAGALIGLLLTPVGKVAAGAPPAEVANYLWNAGVFAAVGACVTPLLVWSSLRHVPLWRIIFEPLAGASIGAAAGWLLGSDPALLVLTPLGAVVAAARLALSTEHRMAA